jgi:hypothetical protein
MHTWARSFICTYASFVFYARRASLWQWDRLRLLSFFMTVLALFPPTCRFVACGVGPRLQFSV